MQGIKSIHGQLKRKFRNISTLYIAIFAVRDILIYNFVQNITPKISQFFSQ